MQRDRCILLLSSTDWPTPFFIPVAVGAFQDGGKLAGQETMLEFDTDGDFRGKHEDGA